jgi:hypothetical protein
MHDMRFFHFDLSMNQKEEKPWEKGGSGLVYYTGIAAAFPRCRPQSVMQTPSIGTRFMAISMTKWLTSGVLTLRQAISIQVCHWHLVDVTSRNADNHSLEARQLRDVYNSGGLDPLQRTRGRYHDSEGPDTTDKRATFEMHSKVCSCVHK